jgi:hypothetical protein
MCDSNNILATYRPTSADAAFALAHSHAGDVPADEHDPWNWNGPTPLSTVLAAQDDDDTEAGVILQRAAGVLLDIATDSPLSVRRIIATRARADILGLLGG